MNRERLQKLAEHLESGKLAHQKFDIGYYNVGYLRYGECGTAGCALGECPVVWPELWRWGGNSVILTGSVDPSSGKEFHGMDAGEEFFEISNNQSRSLFMPSGYPVPDEATALDVAKKIREMLANN